MAEERIYELIFICRPDTPEAEIDKVISTLQQAAEEQQGRVEKVDKWGVRRMAYRVDKCSDGFFVFFLIHGRRSEMVKELERRLKVSEPVLKYLTVRIDEELKRQRKLVARRERRMARRARKSAGETAAAAG
ncbi:MAG TPA: 30S ribosomal protein S6 [Candidatus Dormibacteraeota bacterium]|nr:30S ribosomal protein S6 [Candidatus Dormibacteraeota bacterium]